MIIDCVADLHGFYPQMKGGDLLIVAGDLTANDRTYQYLEFREWIKSQDYKKKIVVFGNHDMASYDGSFYFNSEWFGADFLTDEGIEFDGMKIWGSPWTLTFKGINPQCTAFTGTEWDLSKKFELIPPDIDILITHGPPLGILDKTAKGDHVGSDSLRWTIDMKMPELVIFGHIHECGGQYVTKKGILYVNGSIVDEKYREINRSRKIIFDAQMPKMQRFKAS